jgi:hypothetical protein
MPKNYPPVIAWPFDEAFEKYGEKHKSYPFTAEFRSTIRPDACVLAEHMVYIYQEDVDPLVAATYINSYRLDCRDCLNKKCSQRDPDSPVDEVIKREKRFQEAEKAEEIEREAKAEKDEKRK